jgi:predicted DNA-binding transcriptional regulator AlpA
VSDQKIRILDTRQAAHALGVSAWVLTQAVNKRKIPRPAYVFGMAYGWLPDEIEAARQYLAQRPLRPIKPEEANRAS